MAEFALAFALTSGAFVTAIALMAVGVVFRRPCLRGSCGGPAIHGPDGVQISCATCPNRRRTSEWRRPRPHDTNATGAEP